MVWSSKVFDCEILPKDTWVPKEGDMVVDRDGLYYNTDYGFKLTTRRSGDVWNATAYYRGTDYSGPEGYHSIDVSKSFIVPIKVKKREPLFPNVPKPYLDHIRGYQ
jgi:hypothetical protein